MSIISEFKAFISKGNAMDLAIGVIIGTAFGKIVDSLVQDIITPILLQPALKAAHLEKLEELSYNGMAYGKFLSAIISFLVIGFVLFLVIKGMNNFNKKQEAAVPAAQAGPSQEQLLTEIRDLLKK